jgi:hypothetical protein
MPCTQEESIPSVRLVDIKSLFRGIPALPFLVQRLYLPLFWRSPDAGAQILLFSALSTRPEMMAGGQYVDAMFRPVLPMKKRIE